MNNFRELKIWQKGIDIAVAIYKLTEQFPSNEKYALTSQMKRSGVSISSNIAEGAGRNSSKDFAHFLDISVGSSNELETQLIIAERLSFISEKESQILIGEINEVQKMTRKLISTVR